MDPRAAPGQRYHQAVLEALPPMPVTRDIAQVEAFIRRKKGPEYFVNMNAANDPERLCNEIRYFLAFSLLKQLLAQGLLAKDSCRKLNVALAREYRVFQYQI